MEEILRKDESPDYPGLSKLMLGLERVSYDQFPEHPYRILVADEEFARGRIRGDSPLIALGRTVSKLLYDLKQHPRTVVEILDEGGAVIECARKLDTTHRGMGWNLRAMTAPPAG